MKLKIIFTDEYYKNKNLTDLKLFLKKTDIIVLGAPHNKYYKIKFPTNKKYIDIWGVTKK